MGSVVCPICYASTRVLETRPAPDGAAIRRRRAARRIGQMCLDGLRQLDRVSYLQFASVYKEFADVDDVQAELAELGAEPQTGSVRAAREDAEFPPNAA